jgi:hypothetical protein
MQAIKQIQETYAVLEFFQVCYLFGGDLAFPFRLFPGGPAIGRGTSGILRERVPGV